jgi:hypothetical protein
MPCFFRPVGQRLDQVLVRARHQLVHELDHGHLRAQGAVHGGHLQADDAATHDQQLLRHLGQGQRIGGVHDARVAPREVGQLHRLRTGGDDALLEAQQLHLAVRAGDLQLVRGDEPGLALHGAHLALPGHAGQAAGQLADHLLLVGAQPVQVDLRLAELHAEVAGVRSLLDDRGRVQQRLGRDAADVEAHAAQGRIALDQHGVQAQVRGAEGGGVAAGAGADHHHAALDVGRAAAVQRRPGRGRLGRRAVRRSHRRLAGRRHRRGGGSGAGRVEHGHHVALRQGVADLDPDLPHHAVGRRRHFHRRLVRFQGDQTLVLAHTLAGLDQHLDHRHVAVVADVRHLHLDRAGRGGGRRRGRGGRGLLRRGGGQRGRRGPAGSGFQDRDDAALGQLVADLHADLADHAVGRRRHLHGGLVRLQGDQALVLAHGIARRDQHLDHRHVVVVADVRDLHFDRVRHRRTPLRAARGACPPGPAPGSR